MGDEMKKTKIIFPLIFLLINPVAATYKDTKNHWAKSQIDYVKEKNIMVGYPNGNFMPDSYVKRSEAVSILTSITKEIQTGLEIHYRDVKKDDWYYKSLVNAVNMGYIIDGEKFFPNEYMTRRDFVIMISKAYMKSGSLKNFEDILLKDLELKEALKLLPELFSGYPDMTFRPDGYITRAEIATISKKILEDGYLKRKFVPVKQRVDEFQKEIKINKELEERRKSLLDLIEFIKAKENVDGELKRLLDSSYGISKTDDLNRILEAETELRNYLNNRPQNTNFSLNVNVFDEEANSISHKELFINNEPFKNGMRLNPGKYLLTVKSNGFKDENTYVEIDGMDKSVTVILKRESFDTVNINIDGKFATCENSTLKRGERYTINLNPPEGKKLLKFIVNGEEKDVEFIDKTYTAVANTDIIIKVVWTP